MTRIFLLAWTLSCFWFSFLSSAERMLTTEKGNQIYLEGPELEAVKLKSRYVRQLVELLEQYEFPFKGKLHIAPRGRGTVMTGDVLYLPEPVLIGKDNIFLFLCQTSWYLLDRYFPCELELRNALSCYLACAVIERVDGKQNELKVLQTLSDRLQEMIENSADPAEIKPIHQFLALKVLEHKLEKGWILYALGKAFSLRGRISIDDYLKVLEQVSSEKFEWWREDWWERQELCNIQYNMEILDSKNKIARVTISQKSGQALRFPVDITLAGSQEVRFIPNFFVDSALAEWRGKYNFLPNRVRLNDNFRHPLIKRDLGEPYFLKLDSVKIDQLGMNFRAPKGWKLLDNITEGRNIQVYGSSTQYPHTYLRFVAWESNNNQTIFQVSEEEFNQNYYFETHLQSRPIQLGDQECELRIVDEYIASGHFRSLHVYAQRGQAFIHFWVDCKGNEIEAVSKSFEEYLQNIEFYSPPKLYEQKEPAIPLSYSLGIYGRTAFVVDATQISAEHFPLIPLATKANEGKPLILFHNGELLREQMRLLNRYRPAQIYSIGRIPEAIQKRCERLPALTKFYPDTSDFVLASSERKELMAATLLATRKKLPLVIWDKNDPQWLENCLFQGKIHLVGVLETALIPPEKIASAYEADSLLKEMATDYLVVVNQNPIAEADYFFATQLAAYHKGSILALDFSPETHSFKLHPSDWVPEYLKKRKKKVEVVVSGEGELPDETGKMHSIKFMVPVVDEEQMNMASSTMSSRVYGEPYLILGEEGAFREEHVVPICSTVSIQQKEYQMTTRMKTIVGGLVYGQESEDQILFSSPPPASIRAEILQFIQNTKKPVHLAIVGNPQRFPFYYQPSSLYRENGMTQSELPSDLPYGNLDWDWFAEIAVGRIVTEKLSEDSFLLANIMTFEANKKPVALMLNPGFPDEDSRTQFTTVFPGTEFAFQEMEKEFQAHGYETRALFRRDCTLEDVVPQMSGKDVIFYTNHANQESWTFGPKKMITNFCSTLFKSPPSGTQVMPELKTTPFVYSGGCLSAGLDLGFPREKMFPLVMLDKGAIGFVGNTRFGVGDSGDHIMKEFLNQVFYHNKTVGEALREAKNNLLMYIQNPHLGQRQNLASFQYAYLEEFFILNLFGDPAIRLSQPKENTPAYQVEYGIQEQTLRLKATFDDSKIWVDRVLFPENGKENEVNTLGAPGLFLSNFPRAFSLLDEAPSILPGVYLRIPLPQKFSTYQLKTLKGPRWSVGHLFLDQDSLLIQLHFIRFIPEVEHQGGTREVADQIEFEIKFD